MNLIAELQKYRQCQHENPAPSFEEQATLVERFEKLLEEEVNPYRRESATAHLTASALITNPDFDKVLLTLHAKLAMWLQLGGHADGDTDLYRVAQREGFEESGGVRMLLHPPDRIWVASAAPSMIFDLDVHRIPERKGEPSHWHFDVRFLFIADPVEPLQITAESKHLAWIPLSDAYGLTEEKSMHRQFEKIEWVAGTQATL